MPDILDSLYTDLKSQGYLSKDLLTFRRFVMAQGKDGYKNRRALYDDLKSQGYLESPTFEDFQSKVIRSLAGGGGQPKPVAKQPVGSSGSSGTNGRKIPAGFGELDIDAAKFGAYGTTNPSVVGEAKRRREEAYGKDVAQRRRTEQTIKAVNGDREAAKEVGLDKVGQQLRDRMDYTKATGNDLKHPVLDETSFGVAPTVARDEQGNIIYGENGKPLIGSVNDEVRANTQRVVQERNDLWKATYEQAQEKLASLKEQMKANGEDMTLSKEEHIAKRNTLKAAYDEQQRLIEALEDEAKGGHHGFLDGLWDAAKDADTWLLGLNKVDGIRTKLRVSEKVKSGEALTTEEQELLDATIENNAVRQRLDEDSDWLYRAGRMTTEMLPFVGQIILTGGYGGVAAVGERMGQKWATKYAQKFGEKALLNRINMNVIRGLGIGMGDVAAGFVSANTTGAVNTLNDAMERRIGTLGYDEKGNYQFTDDEDWLRAIMKAEVSQTKEFATERFGEHLVGLRRLNVMLAKQGPTARNIARALSGFAGTKAVRKTSQWLRKGGVNGVVGEVLEEEIGLPVDVAIGDMTWEQALSKKTQGDIVGGMLLSLGAMHAVGLTAQGAGKVAYTAQYYRYKNRADKADKIASFRMTADKWQPLKEQIDGTTSEDMNDLWLRIVDDGGLSVQEKRAAYDYINALTLMRGYNMGMLFSAREAARDNRLKPEQMTAEEAEELAVMNAEDEGRSAVSADEKKQMVDDWVSSGAGSEEPEDLEIRLKAARAQGVFDAAQEGIELRVAQENTKVRENSYYGVNGKNEADGSNGNDADGRVIQVGIGDRTYYIVGGDIQLSGDQNMTGTGIDVEASGAAIVVRDAETGEIDVKSPKQMTLLSVTPTQQMIDYNENVLRQQLTEQADNDITFGSPKNEVFAVNDEVTLNDGNGGTVTGVIEQTTPEGAFLVEISGRVAPFTADELNRRIVAHNGQNLQAFPEEDLSQNGNDGMTEIDDAMPMVGEGEDAEPDFSRAAPDRAHRYIFDEAGLTRDEGRQFVAANQKSAEKELERLRKKAPTIGTSIAKYRKEQADWQSKVDAAQQQVDYWNSVAAQEADIVNQEAEREFAERQQEASGRQSLLDEQRDLQSKMATAKKMYGEYFDDDLTVPHDVMELVAMNMPRNISWEGREGVRGLQQELGLRRGIGRNADSNAFNAYLAKKGEGIGVGAAVHSIWESDQNSLPDGEKRFDDQEIRNALLDMFMGAEKPSDIRDYVVNSRIADAESMRASEDEAQRNMLAEWAEALHLEPEEMEAFEAYIQVPPTAIEEEYYNTIYYNQLAENYEREQNLGSKGLDRELEQGAAGTGTSTGEGEVRELAAGEKEGEVDYAGRGSAAAEVGGRGEAVSDDNVVGGASEGINLSEQLTEKEAETIISSMKKNALPAPVFEITDENWLDNVPTPIGNVKMGENQREKMFVKGRERQYGMLLATLGNPDIVLEEMDSEQNVFHERPSSYLFVKTFQKPDGTKYVHFESVTVSQDGLEVSVSSHLIRENQLRNKLKSDRLLYKATALDEPAISSAEQPTNAGGSHSSEGKGTDNISNGQEKSEKNVVQGLEGYDEGEILNAIRGDIEIMLDDAGLDGVTIKGMALNGSRKRGDGREGSDLDVVVEYEGDISEDGLFNILNENPIEIEGIRVDVNPITKGKSGTLEEYMKRSRAYDEEKLAATEPQPIDIGDFGPVYDQFRGKPKEATVFEKKNSALAREIATGQVVEVSNLYTIDKNNIVPGQVYASKKTDRQGFTTISLGKVGVNSKGKAVFTGPQTNGVFVDKSLKDLLFSEDYNDYLGEESIIVDDLDLNSPYKVNEVRIDPDGNIAGRILIPKIDGGYEEITARLNVNPAEYISTHQLSAKEMEVWQKAEATDLARGNIDKERLKEKLREKSKSWLTDDNLEWAEGKDLQEIVEKFGNTPEPIAVLPDIVRQNVPSLGDDYLYCGKAYLIDHHANHHPELDLAEYDNIQKILDSYDDIKDLSDGGRLKIAFIKKLDKGYAVVVELSKENDKIMLHKTFFYKDSAGKRIPFKNKPSIKEKWSVDGSTTISPVEEQQPAGTENISALDHFSGDNTVQTAASQPHGGIADFEGKGSEFVSNGQEKSGKSDIMFHMSEAAPSLSKQEVALRDALIDEIRQSGLEVSTDWEEGQRILDAANGRATLQKRLSDLTKAEAFIEKSLKGEKAGKRFEIVLPRSTQRMIRNKMGRDYDSHNIFANGIVHSKRNHGVNGEKIDEKSIPLRDEDFKLAPHIMVAPDRISRGSMGPDGRESIRFEKDLSNGVVLVVEKEQKSSPDDMDTITMWATLSSEGADARSNERPLQSTSQPANVAKTTNVSANARTAISGIDAAKIRKDSEMAIKNDEKISYQKVERPIFVSNAARAVEAIKQEKATPEQWLAMIQKNGGLKAGEDKWLGLSDWLRGKNGTDGATGKPSTVTKQEVLDFIRENQIQVEEVNYSEFNAETNKKMQELDKQFLREMNMAEEPTGSMNLRDHADYAFEQMVKMYGDDFRDAFEVSDEDGWHLEPQKDWDGEIVSVAKYFLEAENLINSTHLEYTTEGLENKREIALTVPTIESWNEGDDVHFGDAGGGRAVAWIRFGDTTMPIKPTQEQLQSIYKERADFERKMFEKYGEKDTYLKMSDEERQELDRIAGKQDSIGTQRVLVIDEIQSKRHQEGRERGYITPSDNKRVKELEQERDKLKSELKDVVHNLPHDESLAEQRNVIEDRLQKIREEIHFLKEKGIVPDAPFEKNWHELAMKRMLRYAAENGYDKVAWTKGEQQAERYDIGGVVDSIGKYDQRENEILVEITMHGGQRHTVTVDSEGNVLEANHYPEAKTLSDIVGKEIAVRTLSLESGEEIKGDGLRIGGKGMKGFYDEILPRFMNKYGKQWGVKTGEVEAPLLSPQLGGGKPMTFWSVDVTPEMKESVMDGQPMFFRTNDGRAYGFTMDGKMYIDPRIATAETPIHEYGHLWAQALRKSNPEAWEHLKGQLLGHQDVMDYVKRLYPELEGDELMEEVFTHYGGKRGAERLRNDMREEMAKANGIFDKARVVTIFANLRRALRNFWTAARDLFAGKNERLKSYSAEDFADMMLNDLLRGFKPPSPLKGGATGVGRLKEIVTAKENGEKVSGREDGVLYRDNEETRLKAPNGADSNLSPKQWAQVRTKAFKDWFGDWEKAARVEKLRKSKDAIITGKEIAASDDLREYKKNALEYGKGLRGSYVNEDTGVSINIGKAGIKEVLQHDYKDIEQLQSVAAIPQIIENAIYIDSSGNTNTERNKDVSFYHYYVCGLKIGGEDYTVRAVVAEQPNGERYYDHKLSHIEKGKLLDSLSAIANHGFNQAASDFGGKDTKLISILQTNSSKIVDENGEPMVMYHGTPKDFTVFDREKIQRGYGFWFTQNDFEADNYSYGEEEGDVPRVIPVFLNVRRPATLEDVNGSLLEDFRKEVGGGVSPEAFIRDKYATEFLRSRGYDGLTFGDKAIVYESNQIKSATENNGGYSSENPDIRFRLDGSNGLNGRNWSARDERQREAYARRQWRRAHEVADDAIRKLGLEGRVRVMDFPIGLTGRKAKSKGWYDPKTGKIVIVMNNHRSPEDVLKTILHEGVAHYGLRELFGKHFDDFLDNVYNGASTEIKESIAAKMEELQGRSNGANRSAEELRRVATEEYLAELAESTDFENAENKPWVRHWFNQIKGWFLDMLGKLGLKGGFADGSVVLTDNELRYILWRSYKNLAEPGRDRNPFAVAEDVVMRRRMGVEVPVGLNQDSPDLDLDVAAEAKVVPMGEPELEWHGEEYLSVEEARERIDALSKKYHSAAPIVVTRKDGDDSGLLELFMGKESVEKAGTDEEHLKTLATTARQFLKDFVGGYDPLSKKIIIFADELPSNLYEHTFFHENIHAVLDKMDEDAHRDITVNFWIDSPEEINGVTKAEIKDRYNRDEWYEEFFTTSLARCMEQGRSDLFEKYIEDLSDRKTLDKILNNIGYERKEEGKDESGRSRKRTDKGFVENKVDSSKYAQEDSREEYNLNAVGYDKERESQKRMDLRNASNEASPIDTAREHPDARESRETESLESELLADDGSLFRDGEDGGFADTASYDRVMQQRITRVREAWQDSMISVKTIQDTILKSRGEYEKWDNDKNSFEDAYNAENRMHGISRNEDEWYVRNLYTPLRNAFSDFMEYFNIDEAEAVRYMVSKTGLERNQFYAMSNAAEQKATEIVEKKKSEVEKAYSDGQLNAKDYRRKMRELSDSIRDEARKIIAQFKEDPQAVALRILYHGGLITYADLLAELEQIRRKYVMRAQPLTDDAGNVVSDNYYDGNVRDYSGLTELHDKAGYDKLMQLRRMAIDEKDIEKRIKMWQEAAKMQKELFFSVTEKAVEAVDTIEIDAAQKKLLDDKVIVPIVYQRGTKKRREQVHRLWDAVNASNAWTLKKSYDSGLISKENYQYISGMFDFYMPLRGWDDTEAREQYDYLESTGTAYSPSVVKTYGRLSAADHPLAYMRSMATSAIVGGNKNLMKQHFLRFAMNHPSNLVTFGKMWYERIGTNAGGESIWEPRYPDIPENATADEAANIVAAFNEEMRLKEAEGNATQHKGSLRVKYPIRKSEATEHHVEVVRNGETYVIYINGDPRAAQALNGSRRRMAQMEAGESSRIANVVRWMAANYTSKSPSFTMANLARDITMATTVAAIKEGPGYTALLTANLFRLLMLNPTRRGGAMMPSLMYKYQHGTLDMDKPTERYFYEFMTYGGETGFTALQDIDDIKELMEKEFQKDNREKLDPRRVLSALGDGMEWVNRCIEDATRFATYMASRESGRGVNRSVNDAKNITLNFNRKGTGENLDGIKFLEWLPSNATVRNLYAFVNPAVQAMHTLAHLAKHFKRAFTLVTSTWVAAGVLTPLLNEFLLNAFGDDDDKEKYWSLPKWVRRNNFCLYIPGVKRFIQIPLAQEFRVFYGLGEIATTTYLGHDTIREGALDIVEGALDLLPLDFTGSGGNAVASLSPTLAKPAVDIAFNTSFTGYPIWKETPWNKNEPAFQKAYSRTPSYMIGMSEDINDWTGGNEHLRGWLERTKVGQYANNPAVWQHLAEGYFGGMYSFLSQGGGTLWTLIHGSRPSDMQIPVWNRFVNNPDDRVQSGQLRLGDAYYNLKGDADDIKSMFSAFKKDTKSQDEAVRRRGEEMMAMKHELDKKLKFEQDGMAYEPSVWIDPEIERLYRRSRIFKEYDSEIDKHKGMIERHLDDPKVVLTAEQNIKEAVAEMVAVASSSERPSAVSPDGFGRREERLRKLRTGKKWAQYYDEIATYEDTQADQLLARKKKDAKERGDNASLARIKRFEEFIREKGKKLLGYGHDEKRMENIRLWRSRAIEILEEGEKKENGD